MLNGGTLRIVTGGSFRLCQNCTSGKVEVHAPHTRVNPSRHPRRRAAATGSPLFLFVILAAQLMVVLDTTIVNVALPHIQEAFGFSSSDLSWVLNAYILTFGGFLLLGARAGDLYGRRRVFLGGIALFTVSSLLGGLAASGWMFLAARAAQGLGAALAAPSALSLLTSVFPEGRERIRAIGLYTTVSAAGGALGLVFGGLLTELVSWRWVMFVNVPIGVAIWVIGRRIIRESERRHGRFDLVGAVTSTAGMILIVFGLVESTSAGWTSALTIGSLIAGVSAARGIRRHRAPGGGTCAAAQAVGAPHPVDGECLARTRLRRHVRDVLLRRPVPPGRAGLFARSVPGSRSCRCPHRCSWRRS